MLVAIMGKMDTLDGLFELLADQRRRRVLRCLEKYENPMTLPDLAEEIVVMENDTTIDEVPAEEVKRVYMTLYHRHIPKLADSAIVHYDQSTDMVTLAEDAMMVDTFERFLHVE